MPDQPTLDIATAENWFGLRPGMPRKEALDALKKQGVEENEYDDDYVMAEIGDVGLECWFETSGDERLRQVAADSGGVVWNGKAFLGKRIDEALRAFEPLDRTAIWQVNDAIGNPFPKAGSLPAGPVPDERLMEEGTIWFGERAIGLAVCNGEVIGVAWRDRSDFPTQFAGPVTEAQRQLSQRPDLGPYLRRTLPQSAAPKEPLAWLHKVLVIVCLVLLALIGRAAFLDTNQWNNAPIITGKLVSMGTVPRKRFFDLGPDRVRRLMPDDPTRTRDLYHVEYLDPTGRRQTADLEGADFYVPPREVGEDVQVAYVAGDPPLVKGPSRVRDAAFLDFMPWVMAVGVLFIIGQIALALLPGCLRLVARGLPKAKSADSDRPELR